MQYRIIIYSKLRFLLIFLICCASIIPVTLFSLRFGAIGTIGTILSIGACILFPFLALNVLPKKLAKAIMNLTVSKDCLRLEWEKQFAGFEKESQEIPWENIVSYKYEPSHNFNLLRFNLIDGGSVKFYQWFFDCDDDFRKFLRDFEQGIQHDKRKKTVGKTGHIERQKNLMENKSVLVSLAVMIVLVCSLLVFAVATKGFANPKGLILIGIVLGPLIWSIRNIIITYRSIR